MIRVNNQKKVFLFVDVRSTSLNAQFNPIILFPAMVNRNGAFMLLSRGNIERRKFQLNIYDSLIGFVVWTCRKSNMAF